MEVDSGDLHVYKSGGMLQNICVPVGVVLSLILNVVILLGVGNNTNKIDDVVDTGLGGNNALGKYSVNNRKIVIGVDPEWPPYCYTDNSKAVDKGDPSLWEEPQGFLLEVTREACKLQGLDCLFQLYTNYQECWTKDHSIGRYLENGVYDMCLCWTVTPQRTRRILFPNNDARGFTKKPTAGFLVMAKKKDDAKEWKRLKAVFDGDTCNGSTMVQVLQADDRGAWYDDCGDEKIEDKDRTDDILKGKCGKTCADGKIRIGFIKGWATNDQTFNWIKNKYTGQKFDMTRIVVVDEQATKSEGHISTYNHIAQELESGHIDVGFVYDNVLLEMGNQACDICKGHDLWTSGGLAIHEDNGTVQSGLAFAIGGSSGFFRFDQGHVRDAITAGAVKYIADKEKYCTKCLQYWPSEQECNIFCIGCGTDKPSGGTNYCSDKGSKGR